jgi:hypothetical protein
MEQYHMVLQRLVAFVISRGRALLIGFVSIALVLIGLGQTASANPNPGIDPLRSPIPKPPIIVRVNCTRHANPTCVPIAISTVRAKITSHFYIDGVERGRANRLYVRVCTAYKLSKGYHSVRVFATDSRGNQADTGAVERAIRCN